MITQQKNKHSLHLLLCAQLICGCASTPASLPPDTRQHLGKVYLNSAGATGETFFHADFTNGGAGGAIKGAGQGALAGLDSCIDGAIGAAALAPVVLLVCTPILVSTGIVKGSSAGSTPVVSAETIANLEQRINEILKNADLSPALVATIDEQSQQNNYLAQYEISHGTLPAPETGESMSDVAAKWDYQTMIEIQVLKAGFESDDGKVPMMHFTMTAHVKLVDTKSGSVLQEQDYDYNSSPQPYKTWLTNDYRNVTLEIVKSNHALANNIIDAVFIK